MYCLLHYWLIVGFLLIHSNNIATNSVNGDNFFLFPFKTHITYLYLPYMLYTLDMYWEITWRREKKEKTPTIKEVIHVVDKKEHSQKRKKEDASKTQQDAKIGVNHHKKTGAAAPISALSRNPERCCIQADTHRIFYCLQNLYSRLWILEYFMRPCTV